MSRHDAGNANQEHQPPIGEKQLDEQEAIRHHLGGNGDDVEMGVLAPLVLSGSLAHGDQKSLHVHAKAGEDLVEHLDYQSADCLQTEDGQASIGKATAVSNTKSRNYNVGRRKTTRANVARRRHPSHP
jgi:hypothetical protein